MVSGTGFISPGSPEFGKHLDDKMHAHYLFVSRPANYVPDVTYADKIMQNSFKVMDKFYSRKLPSDVYDKDFKKTYSDTIYSSVN